MSDENQKPSGDGDIIVERRILTEDGKMEVRGPKIPEIHISEPVMTLGEPSRFGPRPTNDEECHCACHKPGGESVEHIRPCCEECPKCGVMIRMELVMVHAHSCNVVKFDHRPGGQVIGNGEDDGL